MAYYCKWSVKDYFVMIVLLINCTYGYSMRVQRAALPNSTVVFNCSKNKSIIVWKFRPVGVNEYEKNVVLYNAFSVNSKLPFTAAVNVTVARSALGFQSTLTITSISLDNAGTYACAEADSDESRVYFDLTVIDEPSCSSNIPSGGQWTEENSTVAVKCKYTFNGTVQPEFMCLWTRNSEITRLERIQQSFTNASLHYFEKNYSALMEYSGSALTCYLCSSEKDCNWNDIRANSSLWHWRSETLLVNYCPTKVAMSEPTNSKLPLASTVTCHADGHPTPTDYALSVLNRDENLTTVVHSSSATLSTEGEYNIVCSATFHIRINGQQGNFTCTSQSQLYAYKVASTLSQTNGSFTCEYDSTPAIVLGVSFAVSAMVNIIVITVSVIYFKQLPGSKRAVSNPASAPSREFDPNDGSVGLNRQTALSAPATYEQLKSTTRDEPFPGVYEELEVPTQPQQPSAFYCNLEAEQTATLAAENTSVAVILAS